MSNMQVISPAGGEASGKLVAVPALADVQRQRYPHPTVLLAHRVGGEEDVPEVCQRTHGVKPADRRYPTASYSSAVRNGLASLFLLMQPRFSPVRTTAFWTLVQLLFPEPLVMCLAPRGIRCTESLATPYMGLAALEAVLSCLYFRRQALHGIAPLQIISLLELGRAWLRC